MIEHALLRGNRSVAQSGEGAVAEESRTSIRDRHSIRQCNRERNSSWAIVWAKLNRLGESKRMIRRKQIFWRIAEER